MKKYLISAFLFLIVAGCATQSVKLSDATEIPQERMYFINDSGNNTADITVIRDSGMMGSGCFARIYIDGALAADLKSAEKVSFRVKEGEHIVGMTLQGGGLCSFSVDLQERDLKVKSGDSKYYRAFVDPSGTPSLMPTTQAH